MKTKTLKYLSLRRLLAALMLLLLMVARNFYSVAGQEFVRGYQSATPLERGMVVRIDPDNTELVRAVRADEAENTLGVVIDPGDAPASLASQEQSVFVATSGAYPMLVSNQNGPITTGDLLTVSAIDGVATKATDREKVIIGKSLADYDGSSNVLSNTEIAGRTVSLARLAAEVGVAANPLYQPPAAGTPAFLRSWAESVSNQPVSTARLYLSLAILLVAATITVILVYSGVRGGLVAIGRNPLSRNSITRNIIFVVVTAVIVFSIGLGAVYLILKL